MKQRYAFIRENPYIIASWIQACPDREIRDMFIDYLHEETPHPEYLSLCEENVSIRKSHRLSADPELGAFSYYYYWLSRGHIVEIAAANNFASEGINKRYSKQFFEAVKKYYGGYPSLVKLQDEHMKRKAATRTSADMCWRNTPSPTNCRKKLRLPPAVLKIRIRVVGALREMVQPLK